MGTKTIKNWDGTQHWQPEAIIKPVNEAEISALIQRAIEEGKRIKPVGSALSWSDIIDIPTIAFQFGNMAKVLEVDDKAKRIRMQAGTKLVQVNDVLADHSLALDNFGSIIKQTAADDIPMSPASGRDSCYIGAYVGSLKWAAPYFKEFEALMRDYDGRPHWGKSFSRTANELKTLYPNYEAFDRLRRRCDPHSLFRNSFVERVFPVP